MLPEQQDNSYFEDLDEGVETEQPVSNGYVDDFTASENAATAVVDTFASLPPGAVLRNVAERVQSIDDGLLPRYGISMFLPIPLYKQHGNNSYVDVNEKDPITGANISNANYYPPFTLLPLVGGSFPIPFESDATYVNSPVVTPEPFDEKSLANPKGFNVLIRDAKQCADTFLQQCNTIGAAMLTSLLGYRAQDPDRGVKATMELFMQVFPIHDAAFFPRDIRERGGVVFKGPFLDQIISIFSKRGYAEATANVPSDAKERAVALYQEIHGLLQNAAKMATTIINETEAEIKDPRGVKKTYDAPNLSVPDAPVSVDYYALAHLNRVELEFRDVEVSRQMGKSVAAGIGREISDAFRGQAVNVHDSDSGGVVTMDEVRELLDRQREQILAEVQASSTPKTSGKSGKSASSAD